MLHNALLLLHDEVASGYGLPAGFTASVQWRDTHGGGVNLKLPDLC